MNDTACTLCPRRCGVNRADGIRGVCKSGARISVARASLHMWEEPCLSHTNGSGTVFFTGCNLGCVYCQNEKISRGNTGKEVSPERLSEIFFALKDEGAHNINLVTPTHFLPEILQAVARAKKQNIGIPFVYNCGGYESEDALKQADGLIDIYLPDFKYMDESLAARYSNAPDYPSVAKKALAEMVRQQPECVFKEDGLIKRGVIVRHLLLPGALKNAKAVLNYLYTTYKNQIYISVMNQFTPTANLAFVPELARRVTAREYDALVAYAVSLGITQAFVQEGDTADESFIPEFDLRGIEKKG